MRVRLSEIRVAGFGGQGVILCAIVIGKAASVFEGNFATMTQAFGPEARGGACSAQVILSSEPVLYPYVSKPDVLVVMSQEAYAKFAPEVKPGGMLLVEEELVKLTDLKPGVRVYGIPATRLAEDLGKKMVLNIVMVGFFAAVTGLVGRESLRDAVADSVPESFRELNLKAYDKGYEYGLSKLKAVGAAAGAEVETVPSLEDA
jgi:2-oxoglutarate ferredoxin oxidoreductase subunit gamma